MRLALLFIVASLVPAYVQAQDVACGGNATTTSGVVQTVASFPTTITIAWDYQDTVVAGCPAATGFEVTLDDSAPIAVTISSRTTSLIVANAGPHMIQVRAVSDSGVSSAWSSLSFTLVQSITMTKPRPPGQPRIVSGVP